MENIYSNLHRKYAVSKILRFELKPIGKIKENIEKNGLLEKDNNYYLGIINPYNRKIFVGTECDDSETDFYEKME